MSFLTTLPFNVTAPAIFLWSKKIEPCVGAVEWSESLWPGTWEQLVNRSEVPRPMVNCTIYSHQGTHDPKPSVTFFLCFCPLLYYLTDQSISEDTQEEKKNHHSRGKQYLRTKHAKYLCLSIQPFLNYGKNLCSCDPQFNYLHIQCPWRVINWRV